MIVTRELKGCVTERKLKDFDQCVENFAEFARISQFVKQPKHVSEVSGALLVNPILQTATILYGVNMDGSLVWLGEMIDSSG